MSGQWTAAQDAALRDGFPTGAPVEEIAARVCGLGPWRSVSAVRMRAMVLGLNRPKRPAAPPVAPAPPRAPGEPAWASAHDALLLASRAGGMTFSRLAGALRAAGREGTTRSACISRLRRLEGRKELSRQRVARPAAPPQKPAAPKASNTTTRIRAEVLQPAAPPAHPVGLSERKVPRPLPTEAATGGVAFLAAGADACRWPLRGTGIGLVICGGGRGAGHSYCPAHMRMAYQRTDTRAVRPPASDMQRARPARAERETDLVDLLAGGEVA
ncbi:GcrA family cell cycle regulator [Xanthobacter oligotrophicus]|uniref:GcrA family cell cycle regulator n=1 Tax=Xanthobacter oligotrophicus TaxID=2607286 RepID=A0ABW6ZRH9_9HYPH